MIIKFWPAQNNNSSWFSSYSISLVLITKNTIIVDEKKPYVKEEIIIKKKPVSETKTISEQVISEKVSVKNPAGEEVGEDKERKEA